MPPYAPAESSENHVVYLAGTSGDQTSPYAFPGTPALPEYFGPQRDPYSPSLPASVAGKPSVRRCRLWSAMSGEEARRRAESSEARAAAVSDIQELMRRKEEIEAQIKANYDVLESVSVARAPGGEDGEACGREVQGCLPSTN